MIKNILIIFISDLKNHLQDRKFMIINIMVSIIPVIIVVFSLPYNKFIVGQFPLNGQLYTLSVILILSYINLKTLQGGLVFSRVIDEEVWKQKLDCNHFTLYFSLVMSTLVQNMILIFVNLPAGILVMSLGGLSLSSLKIFFIYTYLIINLLGIIGMLLNKVFTNMMKMITIYLYLIFASLIVFPLERIESPIYIDLQFFPYLLILAILSFILLIFPPFHKIVDRMDKGEV